MKKIKPNDAVKTTLLTAIFAVGGWMIFQGIIRLFGIEDISPIWNIVIGVIIVWATAYLGLRNLLN